MEKIDLMIVLPTQYNEIIDLTAYDYVPDTPNEALQETIQEKTRIFNNSTLPLFDNYNNAFNCIALSKNESWNSINNILSRQYIRQIYLEMYVYREKLIRFVADMFHLPIKHQKIGVVFKMIKDKQNEFPFIIDLIEAIQQVTDNTEYRLFESIRNDEVHNITRIDRVNYYVNPDPFRIETIGYQKPTEYFWDNINSVLPLMINVKNKIQKIITDGKLFIINKKCRIKRENRNEQTENAQ